ncbi:acyl-CoA N-acyltransferase [Xylariaceae sp. AK1471]|nr:acyl-CoA N-acyltransferase [Xylariaceae sp. AK1471]
MTSENPALIKVKTTLPAQPFPANSARPSIKTERLVIRPLTQDDLQALHALRTQSEVMACTALGRIDQDLAETQKKLDPFLAPRDAETYNPAICLASTGELIGLGGVFQTGSELGWPEVGYMLKSEHWGRGYATEFLKAFVQLWWSLPRSEVETEVDALSLGALRGSAGEAPEMLCAMVEAANMSSLRVMEKAGFKKFKTWTETSRRVGSEGTEVTLVGFVSPRPERK